MGMFKTPGADSRSGVVEGARQAFFAAAGTNQATAATLKAPVNVVSGASGTNAVVLPKAKIQGRQVVIYSSAATNALLVFPPVGGTINSGTINASFSATARTRYDFMCVSADGLNWIC